MSDVSVEARLKRMEAAIKELKGEQNELAGISKQLASASQKFVKNPSASSAKVFLSELGSSTKGARTATVAAAWTTVTVTVVTILSDDQGD